MATAQSGCDAALLAKLHRAVLPIACLMIGFCYLDRSNIAYMQLQLQNPPPAGLDFSDSLYGNASGLFFIGYSAFQIPSNLILAKVGAPRWLTLIVVLWGLSAALMACMRTGGQFLLLRLALGVFEAGTFPGIWYHLTLFYPKTDMTIPLAATTAAIMVSQILSAPVAAVLISLDGVLELRGWQWLAIVEGGMTVMVGISLLWCLPPRPEAIKSLNAKELSYIASHVSRPTTSADVKEGLKTAVASPALWRLALVFALKSCAAYALIFWTPLVISDLLGPSGRPLHAILLTSVPYAFAAAAAMGVGWLSHKYNERVLHTAVPFFIGGVTLMLSPALHGGGTATRIASFFALCIALSSCNATAPLTASLLGSLPRPAQAGGLALWNTLASVAGYVGPAVFGWMKEATGGNTAGMAMNGAVLLLGAWVIYTFDEEAAFRKAQLGSDTENLAMLPRSSARDPESSEYNMNGSPTRCEGSLGTPESHRTVSHRSVASSVASGAS